MNLFRLFALSPLLFTAVACAEKAGPALKPSGDRHIAIPSAAFGKEYLLSTSVIPQAGAPTGTGLLGRIVIFEAYEDEVDLYESTRGQVVTEDLPARRLLATFPVVSKTSNEVVIDFNQGMRRLIYQGWYSSSRRFDSGASERAAELPQARVFGVSSEGDRLVVR